MTRAQLEARRLKAIPDLSNGTPAGKLAKKLHVSRMTISRWKDMLSRGADELKARKAPGRPCRIDDAQRAQIKRLYACEKGQWTQIRFASAVSDELGITYSPDHMGRIMHQLGLTVVRKREARS